jgi:chromosome segregation ATPase
VDEIENKKKLEKNPNIEENDLNVKKLEEEIDNTIINNYKSKLDKKNNEIDKLMAKCKEYKENLEQNEKDKEIKLKELQKEKEVLEYEIKDKSKKLEIALRELNELRSNKEGEGEANKEITSEDPKQKLYDEIKEYKKEIEMKNKENNDLKNKLDKCEINYKNELKAQTEYLNNMIEDYKKNIDNIKEQKIKACKDYKEQIEKYEVELGKYKCQLANVHFEMEKKLILYKNYVRKLQMKLEGLGFKFKDSNHDNNKVTLNKAKTIV